MGGENIPLRNLDVRNEKYRRIFEQCDENRNGLICFRELNQFLNQNINNKKLLTKKAVKRIQKSADSNGDKTLDYDEFVEMLERQDFQDMLGGYISWYLHAVVPHPKTVQVDRPAVLRSMDREVDETDLCQQYSCCPPPIFMFLISMIQFALFITDQLTSNGPSYRGVTAVKLQYDPDKRGEAWRYVTYMFVHMGYYHIIVNLIVQLAFGTALEMVNKSWRVLLIYFLGGLAGCLAHGILDYNAFLGGASGGVYALMTAHLAQVFMNIRELDLKVTCIQVLVISLLVFPELGQTAYQRYYLNKVLEAGVTCHLGGALAGFLVGIYIIRNLVITRAETYFWWIALVIFIILMGTGIALNIQNVRV